MLCVGAMFGMFLYQMLGGFLSFLIGSIISLVIFYKVDKKILRAIKYLLVKLALVIPVAIFLTFGCIGCSEGTVLKVSFISSVISEIIFILLFWLIYRK